MSRETFVADRSSSFSRGSSFSSSGSSSRGADSSDYALGGRRSSRGLSSDAFAVSSRSSRDFASSTRGGVNYTDSDEKRKKKGKLRDEMGDEDFLRGCETGLERRLARLDRMGVLRTATATTTNNNSVIESSRHRDVGLTSQRHDRERDQRRQQDPAVSTISALCRAASSGDVDGLEKLLRRMSSDDFDLLNVRGADGKSPLLLAADCGHLPVICSLLTGRHRRYVDLNARSSRDGRSAVHVAVQHGQYEVVKFLLLQGASANQRDDAGRPPIAYAQRMGDDFMVALIRVGELRRKLLEVSARGDGQRVAEILKAGHSLVSGDPQRKDSSVGSSIERRSSLIGSSSMRFAASLWKDAVDNALLLAASSGHMRCVVLLVDRGADLDVPAQSSGRTALHLAVRGGHFEVASYLLDRGADPRVVDFDSLSARDEAIKSKDSAIAELFASSSGSRSGKFDRKDRRALQKRRSSVSWGPEVMTQGGSSSDADSFYPTTVTIGTTTPPASTTTTDRSSSTASSTTGSVSPLDKSGSLLIVDSQVRLNSNLWEDPLVLAARIPLDKLEIGEAMSRGAYGDVYRGWYRGEPVAIKKLHPSMSHDMAHISAFLGEIKLMAAMDHPQIVRFVGVAWDALSEVCAVSELMPGGDLGAMLQDLRTEGAPRGFRRHPIKLKLAAEVTHALTYLHSLDPAPVLHRDLKSRNILLTADRHSAKLTDFGTSRETSDVTLTAGVGTSLWMAPEVIMGERYGIKADVFSLGVVLSELATHELPYAHATERETGRPLSVAAVLHAVVSGTLELDFAEREDEDSENNRSASLTVAAAREVAKVARSCVRLEPAERPTAAQVACVLRRLLQSVSLENEP